MNALGRALRSTCHSVDGPGRNPLPACRAGAQRAATCVLCAPSPPRPSENVGGHVASVLPHPPGRAAAGSVLFLIQLKRSGFLGQLAFVVQAPVRSGSVPEVKRRADVVEGSQQEPQLGGWVVVNLGEFHTELLLAVRHQDFQFVPPSHRDGSRQSTQRP